MIDFPLIYIEQHKSEIPWLKIFTKIPRKEFSDCTAEEKAAIWMTLDVIERLMLEYYQPEKINIASFGNMLPHVHWHIMARFKKDSYFPEPMWGSKQRDASLELPSYDRFIELLHERLEAPENSLVTLSCFTPLAWRY
ncbi:MAG: HIT family protein [Epsilonproteobacteria bacterium]|nr:MAG: HIT family protein [Campylobacterota bacterium]